MNSQPAARLEFTPACRKCFFCYGIAFTFALTASMSHAATLDWSGSGFLGNDSYGHQWEFYNAPDHSLPGGTSLFSIPGFGLENSMLDAVSGLQLTFELPPGVSIDFVTPDSIASGNSTIFYHSTDTTIWNELVLGSNSVEFSAPSAELLDSTDRFFANVYFDAPMPNGVSFSATWILVPEPSSLVMIGLLGTMFCLRSRRACD